MGPMGSDHWTNDRSNDMECCLRVYACQRSLGLSTFLKIGTETERGFAFFSLSVAFSFISLVLFILDLSQYHHPSRTPPKRAWLHLHMSQSLQPTVPKIDPTNFSAQTHIC